MDLYMIADTVTIATKQGLGFAKFTEQSAPSNGLLQISAVVFPVDALAPPPVKSNSCKTVPRTLLRKKRRTRRRSLSGADDDGNSEGGEDAGFFGDGGDCDGPFGGGNWSGGGGGGGGGGRGWNFDGFGGQNWDDYSSNSSSSWSGSAFNFVYEVLCWIALSNCVHFAFKKMVRIVEEREKVPMRLTSVC